MRQLRSWDPKTRSRAAEKRGAFGDIRAIELLVAAGPARIAQSWVGELAVIDYGAGS